MPCIPSCMISAVFIIAMIYFYNIAPKNYVVSKYKSILSPELREKYEKITNERLKISYQGYILGFLLSILIIYYNYSIKNPKLKPNNISLVCIVLSTSFITNYFYYLLYPKSDWMLNYLKKPEEIKAWLELYRTMQFNYHLGLALGIIGVGIFAYAFRC